MLVGPLADIRFAAVTGALHLDAEPDALLDHRGKKRMAAERAGVADRERRRDGTSSLALAAGGPEQVGRLFEATPEARRRCGVKIASVAGR